MQKWRPTMQERKKRKPTYGEYYKKLMMQERKAYDEYLKRIKSLRKKVISLGDVPKKNTQLIKTLNYFVELVNLATNFVDKGKLKWYPIKKEEELREFEETIYTLTCRNRESSQVQNKTQIGKTVTNNTLYIGIMYEAIEGPNPCMKQKIIDGKLYQVEVNFAPISDWINGKIVRTCDNQRVSLKQPKIAQLVENLKCILLKAIENVLK